MFKDKLGKDSPIQTFIHLKIRRRDGVESLSILEESKLKVPIGGCISAFLKALADVGFLSVFGRLIHNLEAQTGLKPWVDPSLYPFFTTALLTGR